MRRALRSGFATTARGYLIGMALSLLLIIVGIVVAILWSYILGIILILIGLALLVIPRLGAGTSRV